MIFYFIHKTIKLSIFILSAIVILSCKNKPHETGGDWIKGNEEEQVKTIEKQFRGFDVAMMEVDYRYRELYWAGKDENWDYAAYQLDKIKLTIENGLERRPKRAKSAAHFLQTVLPEMKKSVDSRDTALFNKNFQLLTLNCNSCHVAEQLPFFTVQPPALRVSSIRK